MVNVNDFPTYDLLPKEVTQAYSFVKKNPTYDGRGTVIAILDTGVDVGAPGLKITSEGKQKIIEAIDCTGAGDIKLYDVPEKNVKNEDLGLSIIGCSGKKLLLNSNWSNPSKKWKIGMKSLYKLFPKGLLTRIKDKRKEAFEKKHHQLLADVKKEIIEWDNSHTSNLTEDDVLKKNDLNNRLTALIDLYKKYDDPGSILDCVVFHDGENWRTAIDIDGSGDLRSSVLLTDFNKEYQYMKFGDDDQLNFSVNFYDEGETLSIVTVAGSHGTHVAAIASAYFPESNEQNGVAPGAQIVSLKIGDTRLGSMETGVGLTRAAICLSRLKCDLANMSYGEGSKVANVGSFCELIRDEIVNKTGTVFVSSAGNNGPALSTVGSPGGTTEGVISVGAYVTSGMMEAEYSLLEKVPDGPYTWSSCGPTEDGDTGVSIYAPGGAITSVPTYTLSSSQLMNGTSMSSPNCCGCISLLISALKMNNIPYSPYRIKKTIQRTSKNINDPMKVGLIQVENAFEDLVANRDNIDQDITFKISFQDRNNARGLYLRDVVSTNSQTQHLVNIQPVFMESEDTEKLNQQKLNYEVKLSLVTSVGWVQCPKYLLLNNGGRSFSIKVNPTVLNSGLHYTEIEAYNSNSNCNPIFKIPITIVKPENKPDENVMDYNYDNLTFGPGKNKRIFISVPKNSNFVEVVLKSKNRDTKARFILQTIQLVKDQTYSKYERYYTFNLNSNSLDEEQEQKNVKFFKVIPDIVLELCLAQFWSSIGDTEVSFEVHFHGIFVNNSSQGPVVLNEANLVSNIELYAPIRKEGLNVTCLLDKLEKNYRPIDYNISPMMSRDILPNTKQIFQLELIYEFKVRNSTTISLGFPSINNILYDSSHEGFFLIIYDSCKKVIEYGDIFMKNMRLSKGEYTVKVQILSKSIEYLEKLNSMIMIVNQVLIKGKEIGMSFYRNLGNAISSKNSGYGVRSLNLGEHRPLYVLPNNESLNNLKEGTQGSIFYGELKLYGVAIDGGLYTLQYIVGPENKSKDKSVIAQSSSVTSSASNSTNGSSTSINENSGSNLKLENSTTSIANDASSKDRNSLNEALRDLQISYLKKLKDNDLTALLAKLEVDYPDHIPLMISKLNILCDEVNKQIVALEKITDVDESKKKMEEIKSKCIEIIDYSDKIKNIINVKELSSYYGIKHQKFISEDEKKERQENDKKKENLIITLNRECETYNNLLYILKLIIEKCQDENEKKSIEQNFNKYLKASNEAINKYYSWADPNTFKYVYTYATNEKMSKRYGNALVALNKYINDIPMNDLSKSNTSNIVKINDLKLSILKELDWTCWSEYEENQKLFRFPNEYELLN